MLSSAQSEAAVSVKPDQLDSDPWLLNCWNGTIELRTGTFREHRREDLITKVVPVSYDPNAQCPQWNKFLADIMGGSTELISFLQRAIGYSLTGDTSEQVMFILHGVGRNGKSTFVECIHQLLGDYAMRTPTETLMAREHEGIPNDVARLQRVRFAHASEGDDGKRLSEAKIKDMTGGDTISARFMRAEWFDFQPEFKIWFCTNHKPVVRGTDEGIWRRLKLIPFKVIISAEAQDKALPLKLRNELPGILNWAVQGCLEWAKHGLGDPDEVREAVSSYRAEMDTFGDFLAECCTVSASLSVTATTLYNAYTAWAKQTGESTLTQKVFGSELGGRGYSKGRNNRGIVYSGLTLSSILGNPRAA